VSYGTIKGLRAMGIDLPNLGNGSVMDGTTTGEGSTTFATAAAAREAARVASRAKAREAARVSPDEVTDDATLETEAKQALVEIMRHGTQDDHSRVAAAKAILDRIDKAREKQPKEQDDPLAPFMRPAS
jgi:hypothetical protein